MSRLKRLIVEAHQRLLWQALVVYLGASFAVLEAADRWLPVHAQKLMAWYTYSLRRRR
jgi:hypothetical protein